MAVKIDEMVAELRLTLDKFSAPLKKAEKEAKKSSGKMKRSFDTVGKAVTSLKSKVFSLKTAMAGLGVVIAINGIKNTLNMADSIGKVAKAAGITTDTLQKYQFAAEQSGVKTETLNKSLLGFNIRLGELKQGRGLLFTFLETYDKGFQKALAATTSTDEALKLMFKGLAKVKDGATLASLNMAAFGGAALKMTNIIKDGIGPFNELIAQAERYGIIINSKFIKAAEATNDKLNIMTKILRVVKTEIVFALIPFIQKLADKFRDNKKAIVEVTKGLAKLAMGIASILGLIGNNPVIGSVGIVGFVMLGTVGKILLIGTIALLNKIKNVLLETQKIEPIRVRSDAEKKLIDIEQALRNNIARIKEEREELAQNMTLKNISEKEYLKGLVRTRKELEAQKSALIAVNKQLEIVRVAAEIAFEKGGVPSDKKGGIPKGNAGGKGKGDAVGKTDALDVAKFERELQFQNQVELHQMLLAEEAAFQEQKIAIASAAADQRNQIERISAAKRLAFEQSSNRKKIGMVLGTLKSITQGSQQSSKKLFQLNKVAGVASATIDAFKGAGRTLGQYPAPFGPALAAIHLATGLANARNIAKQSFTGSVGGGSITGGAVPNIPATPNISQDTNRQNSTPQQKVEIFVKGEVFTAQVLDDVIDGINERVGNNVELVATRVA